MSGVAAMTADLRTLVECESPSADRAAVATSADVVADLGERLTGAAPERIVVDGRTHLRWRFGPPGVLLLGHHDTVWPVGSLAEHPWRVEDGRAYGPGCFDMKAGLVQLFHSLSGLSSLDGITVLVTGDEELGALTSRPLLHEEAARADAAFVLEASADGGALKTARKGVAWYEVRVTGRAAHAGLEPWNGVNAVVELAHQVLAIAALDRGPDGATVTPTLTAAGTTANTVPATASVHVDARVPTAEELRRVDDGLFALAPRLTGAEVDVVRGPRHPPFEPSSSAALYALACSVAERLGLGPLASAHVGGASDGNIVAGDGTPTLDGLGAVGAGAHAPGEYVLVDELPRRAALLAGLVDAVRDGSSSSTNPDAADRTGRP
ncbi:M20 family metallopeptidase [Jiangella endophytica]|uniref:M20 family metallopeptidase n=1 Tax=Jiangella endophytica TaxID=1623398 RepID=UPI0018E576E2|nr:M20 family metallopeptidase [Jiangella endophytica]